MNSILKTVEKYKMPLGTNFTELVTVVEVIDLEHNFHGLSHIKTKIVPNFLNVFRTTRCRKLEI